MYDVNVVSFRIIAFNVHSILIRNNKNKLASKQLTNILISYRKIRLNQLKSNFLLEILHV